MVGIGGSIVVVIVAVVLVSVQARMRIGTVRPTCHSHFLWRMAGHGNGGERNMTPGRGDTERPTMEAGVGLSTATAMGDR